MERMHRAQLVTFVALAILVLAATTGWETSVAASEPVTAVHVAANTLVDASGQPMRLLGVNHSGSEYACIQGWGFFDGATDDPSIAAMRSWHINAVRLSLNEDCWLGGPDVPGQYTGEPYRAAIADYVARLNQAGLIVVLDLHWSAPTGQLATGQQAMADADKSPAFWRSVATQFRHDPGAIFDLYNEPHDISWDCWRDGCTTPSGWRAAGMQQLIDAVRSTGATQPVIATANGWGNDIAGWLSHRPDDPAHQLVAGVHLYDFTACSTQHCWQQTIAPLAAQVPVVTAELGQTSCDNHDFIDAYTKWADTHDVSYLAWTWNAWGCHGQAQLIASPDGTPTPYGAAYRDHLASVSKPAAPGLDTTATPPVTPASGPARSTQPASGHNRRKTSRRTHIVIQLPRRSWSRAIAVQAGQRITIVGRIEPEVRGEKIQLRYLTVRSSRRAHPLATLHTDCRGRFETQPWRPRHPGLYKIVAIYPRSIHDRARTRRYEVILRVS